MRNNGPSPVEFAAVTIMLPFKYNKEEDPNYLLYLMEVQVSRVTLVSDNLRKFSETVGSLRRSSKIDRKLIA